MFILTLHGQWDSDLVSDIHIMDGVTEEATGVILAIGDQDGDIRDGDTQATGDLVTATDTTITHIATEEEVQLLIMAEETTLLTEISPQTEATTVTEITPTETILPTEVIIQQTDKTDTLILEEALQTEELTIRQAQISQTEEVLLRDKVIVTTILTEDQAAIQQPEITIAVITTPQQEATLLAHHVL